jgi:hypothetical protein
LNFKKRMYILLLAVVSFLFSLTEFTVEATIGNVFQGMYFSVLVLVTYLVAFRFQSDYLRLELSRFAGFKEYIFWKSKKIALLTTQDVFFLLAVGTISLIIQGGDIQVWHYLVMFIGLFTLIYVYSMLLLICKLLFKTSIPVFIVFFLLIAHSIIDIQANPFLNAYASLHLVFWMYELPADPDYIMQYYNPISLFAYLVSLLLIVSLFSGAFYFKVRKKEL